MRKHIKIMSFIICLAFIFTILSACGSSTSTDANKNVSNSQDSKNTSGNDIKPKEKVEIEWSTWGNPGETGIFDEFTEQFNKKHADSISLKFTPVPSSGYSQKILSSLAAGIAPDVFYVKANDITTFTKENRLVDLRPMMEASETVKPDVFALNIFGEAVQGDKIYGIVPDCNPLVIFYNIDMIKALGEKTPQEYIDEGNWNRDTFSRIAIKAAEAGKHGFVLDIDSSSSQTSIFLGDSDEGLYFDPEGTKVDLDNPVKAEGLRWIYELSKAKGVTEEVQIPKGQDQVSLFASNQAAMIILGRWGLPVFKDIEDFKWDIAPLPSTNDGREVKPSVAVSYIAMNADTKYQDAAFTFIEEYCNRDGQTFRLKDGGNALPSLKDPDFVKTIVDDGIVGHPEYFIQGLNNGVSIPRGTQRSPEAATAVFDAMRQMFLGKIDVEKCIELAKTNANPILEEANK